MLEFIRKHQRLSQIVLLIFIVPSFAFVGLESYSRMTDDSHVAKVAGQKVSQQEWESSLRENAERLRQEYGSQVDSKIFESPEFKNEVLEKLVLEKAMAAEVASRNMTISDQVLQQYILQQFRDLRTPDGQFDKKRFASILAERGLTPEGFDALLRRDMAFQQIQSALLASAFLPKDVANRISDIAAQEREVQLLRISAKDYVSKVKVSDAMLTEFYNKNTAIFEIPEQMKAEYVVLTPASIAAGITVSDADIKSYYDQNSSRYASDEQRRASHILILSKTDASDADKAAAKSKAEAVLAKVRKAPADFAKLAKENSQDPGSAAKGGDLGFFSKDKMVKPFAEAAFKLKKGEVSDLVQSEFGYHIIQLTDTRAAAVRPLSEVKTEITNEIKRQLVAKKLAEVAEAFSNTVYEQSDSLKPVADKLKLKIETVSGLKRDVEPNAAPGTPYNNERFLKAMFSDETIKNKRNSEAVEIGAGVMIAGRVLEYKPKAIRPFTEVQAAIKERVTLEEATKLAKADGEAKLAKLKAGEEPGGFGEKVTVSRVKREKFHPMELAAILKADASKLPAYTGLEFPLQGYAIFRITKLSQPSPDVARRKLEQQRMAGIQSQHELLTYFNTLKKKAKAEILKPAKASDNKN